MNVKEEKICRLCLKVVDRDYEIIDDITRKMFEGLLLKVNLDISKDPIICKDCAEIAGKCFNFKSVYIDTVTFELKNVYKVEKDIENVDDNSICRFCLNQLCGSNTVLLNTLINDITFKETLQVLMPEVHLDIIRDSVICTSCKQELERYIKFVQKCLHVEEKISKYLQRECTPFSVQIKLGEILGFSFKNILELDRTQIRGIKQENALENITEANSEVYDIGTIKSEEVLDIKDEEDNFSETPLDLPIYKLNMPCGLKANIRKTLKTSTKFSDSSTATIKSNTILSETGMGKAYQTENKAKLNKEINQMPSTKKIMAKRKRSFKTHMLIHENITEVKMYKCSMCTYKTKEKGNLKKHMLIHKDVTEVEMYKCSLCTYETKRKNYLKNHMLIHKNITEVEMSKCSLCSYETKRKDRLKTHMLIHKTITEVEMYKCSICTYESRYKTYLKSHMLTHKDITEVAMHKCSMCLYETKRKASLVRHMLIHKDVTEVEMYKCSMCTYETKHKKSLKNHMLVHKDVAELEMYKCSVCAYETKHKGSLKTHMLVHKDITEVEMYKCSMCTHETKYKKSLKIHMLTHKEIGEIDEDKSSVCTYETKDKGIGEVEMYKCSMCIYETRTKNNLKSHMLVHKDVTEVEMYKCTICTYETKRKNNYVAHTLIHKDITEVEMHKCTICSYKTIHKSSMKKHICKPLSGKS